MIKTTMSCTLRRDSNHSISISNGLKVSWWRLFRTSLCQRSKSEAAPTRFLVFFSAFRADSWQIIDSAHLRFQFQVSWWVLTSLHVDFHCTKSVLVKYGYSSVSSNWREIIVCDFIRQYEGDRFDAFLISYMFVYNELIHPRWPCTTSGWTCGRGCWPWRR